MELIIESTIFKVGDDINTDVIIPGKYLIYMELNDLEKYAFEPLGEDVREKLKKHHILVAGHNFGCGSAREQGATAIKALGIKAVIAKSFARIFFRNAINSGIPVVECPALCEFVSEGDQVRIDIEKGIATAKGRNFTFVLPPPSISQILKSGGLFEYLKDQSESGKI